MSGMAIPGLHLTQIGSDDFLLEPSRALNIGIGDELVVEILRACSRPGPARCITISPSSR